VPKANLYYYFQTKENLYSKVLLGFVEPLLEASAALRESDDPMIGLRAYVAARIRIAREHPAIAKVFSGELLLGGRQLPDECRDLLHAEARRNVDCLRSWIDAACWPVDPEHLMLFIWSATRTYTNIGWQWAASPGAWCRRMRIIRRRRRRLRGWCWRASWHRGLGRFVGLCLRREV
jgi:TetR/AcrR family transcriptional regulator